MMDAGRSLPFPPNLASWNFDGESYVLRSDSVSPSCEEQGGCRMITLRLEGLTRKYVMEIDDEVVRLIVPKVLSTKWDVSRDQVAWIGDEAPPPEILPAVAPRILPLVTNRNFRLNFALFFRSPQRVVVRTNKRIGPMPFSVEESIQGVWADGAAVTILKRTRALAVLQSSGISTCGSPEEAVTQTTEPWSIPFSGQLRCNFRRTVQVSGRSQSRDHSGIDPSPWLRLRSKYLLFLPAVGDSTAWSGSLVRGTADYRPSCPRAECISIFQSSTPRVRSCRSAMRHPSGRRTTESW